jgi:hypothetical protein
VSKTGDSQLLILTIYGSVFEHVKDSNTDPGGRLTPGTDVEEKKRKSALTSSLCKIAARIYSVKIKVNSRSTLEMT